MSAELQKQIYESISAVRDALPTEVAEKLFQNLVDQLETGVTLEPDLTARTIRRWIDIEVQ